MPKLAEDLTPGDKIKADDGTVLTVSRVSRGFVRYATDEGGSEGSVLIDWKDGDWSQLPKSEECTLA